MSEDQKNIEIAEISSIMANESGRNVMWRILQMSGIDAPVFNSDPVGHAYRAGAREIVGIPLRNLLKQAAPGNYLQMMKEHSE